MAVALDVPRRPSRAWAPVVLLACLIAAAVFGLFGLAEAYAGLGQHPSAARMARETAMLGLGRLPDPLEGRDLPSALGFARTVMPLAAVLLAGALAWTQVRNPLRLRLMRARGEHVVIAGNGNLARTAALHELGEGGSVLLWIEGSRPAWIGQAARLGAGVVAGDDAGRSAALLGLDKARGVLLLADDATNAHYAALAMSQAAATRPAGDPLTIIARIDDRALQAGVEARCNGVSDAVARVRFASLPDLAARQLFLARPLDAFRHAGRGARKVFVFGYSPTVASYVRRVRAGGHFRDGVPPEFVVVDPRAAQLDVELRARLPGADMLSPLHFEEGAYDRPGEADHLYDGLVARHGEPIAVIVDTGDDRLTSAIAETVDARYRREDRACPIIHVRIESDSEAPAGATIHRFGGSDDFADPALLTQEGHDALARSIHDFYLEGRLSEGDRIGSRGSMHEWEALGENFRDDNRLVADCYQLKLRDIGARVIGGGGPPLRLEAEELEELSRAEHGRWMASKLLDGWVHGPQRDDARRVHPDIVPYDALSERIKDLDREQVRVMTRLLSATGKRPLRVITLALAPGGGAGLAAGLPAVLAAVAEHYPDRVPVLSGALADAESRRALAAAGQRARLVVGGHVDAVLASLDEADRAAATALVRDADTLIGVPADGDLNGQVFAGADLLVTTSASIEAPCPVIRLAASGAILAAPWRS